MTNKEIAMKAMQELFVKRNKAALDNYWTDPYVQHNPNMLNGLDGIRGALPYLPEKFIYEPGIVIAENDIVMAHSRVEGWGDVPQIIVDVFRIKDGKIIEHWDVIQPEVIAAESKNGNPMTSFHIAKYNMNSITLPGNKFLATAPPLSIELSFGLDNTVTFVVTNGAGLVPDGHIETLPVQPVEVRKNIFFLGWTENSGATVTHLEDYNRELLYTHITMPDGTFIVIKGTITPLTTASIMINKPEIKATLAGKIIRQTYDDVTRTLSFTSNEEVEINTFSRNTDQQLRTVNASITAVTNDCFLISWQEEDKTSVVQVIDLALGTSIENRTPAKGALITQKGTITW